MHIEKEKFGTTIHGEEVYKYTVKNSHGYELSILNYGGIIQKFLIPDKNGKQRDVVLGFDTLAPYEYTEIYMGGILGRYANRLTNGQYELNEKVVKLSQNEGSNHFHGGFRGYHKRLWKVSDVCRDTDHGIELTYISKNGEEGYQGDLINVVAITLSDYNEVKISFHATCSSTTAINLSYSAFFNFLDAGRSSIKSHELQHFADLYTPITREKTVTGKISKLTSKLEMLRKKTKIQEYLDLNPTQIGIDNNLVVEKFQEMSKMVLLYEEESGIEMEISGTQPCLQIYTGQHINHTHLGKNKTNYLPYAGICLEPQSYPDSINHPEFPPSILKPTGVYKERIHYSFSVKK